VDPKAQVPNPEQIEKIIGAMSPAQMAAAIKGIQEIQRRKQEGMLYRFAPNDSQIPILNSLKAVKLVIGGNRSGKSHCSAYETACHITGVYPDWWEGYRFHEPIDCGIVSVDTDQMIKGAQQKMMGWPDEFGTGFIPKDLIIFDELKERPQTNGCLQRVSVRHASGGNSRVFFMTFEQKLKSFMGFMWRHCWFDEEPPFKYFDEVRFRMMDKGGRILLSFYPPDGQTELLTFLDEMMDKTPEYIDQFSLQWSDNPTLDPETVEMMEKTTPDWLKESRKYGRPGVGEGRVIPFSRDVYTCEPFEIEPHWPQIAAIDVGYDHGTGAVCLALDNQSNTIYAFREYFSKETLPAVHASALRKWGKVPFIADAPMNRRESNGKSLYDVYQEEGLEIITRQTDVMASINKINTVISERRFYVFDTCRVLLDQMGKYRRSKNEKTGKITIVKKDDDVIDPLRSALMNLEEARLPGVPKNLRPIPEIREWSPVDTRLGI